MHTHTHHSQNQFLETRRAPGNMYAIVASQSMVLVELYWWVKYLVICSNNAIGGILNWQISLPYGEEPMLVVLMAW